MKYLLVLMLTIAAAAGGYCAGIHRAELEFDDGLMTGMMAISILCDGRGHFEWHQVRYACTRKGNGI